MILLGLDVGSNSLGSAWVDTELQTIRLAASVFPAGVGERENKRAAPVCQSLTPNSRLPLRAAPDEATKAGASSPTLRPIAERRARKRVHSEPGAEATGLESS